MMRALVLLWILAMAAIPAAAQNCGYGLPCGPVPWSLPQFPRLASPTPIPDTIVSNAAAATATPTITPTIWIGDTGGLMNAVATLQASFNATPISIMVDGTPVNSETGAVDLASNSATFFSYMKGLGQYSLGPLAPLLSFSLLVFGVVLATTSATYLMPLILAVLGILRKIISLIFDFLPF